MLLDSFIGLQKVPACFGAGFEGGSDELYLEAHGPQ